jgi:hypothetical protein
VRREDPFDEFAVDPLPDDVSAIVLLSGPGE